MPSPAGHIAHVGLPERANLLWHGNRCGHLRFAKFRWTVSQSHSRLDGHIPEVTCQVVGWGEWNGGDRRDPELPEGVGAPHEKAVVVQGAFAAESFGWAVSQLRWTLAQRQNRLDGQFPEVTG